MLLNAKMPFVNVIYPDMNLGQFGSRTRKSRAPDETLAANIYNMPVNISGNAPSGYFIIRVGA